VEADVELQDVSQIHAASRSAPGWMVSASAEEDGDDDVMEEERTWRDPSAHKLRSAVGKWMRTDHQRMEIVLGSGWIVAYTNHSSSPFSANRRRWAQKHNRDLVLFLLSFAGPESSSKLPRSKLNGWLTLFSKFTNPRALHMTDILHSLFLTLISHPDCSLQRLSLRCLLAYKSPHLSSHEDQLSALLDDTRWREELTALDMGKFQPQDRPELVDVIIPG